MLDFQASKEISVKASPEAVFDIVSDFTKHAELAGSGEVLRIRKLTEGPVGLGTMIEADESINVGGQQMDFPAKSIVVTCDAPSTFSWIPIPPFPMRRIQWWFNLIPQEGGTRVVHEVEVDMGEPTDPQLKALKDNYEQLRAGVIAQGMDKTLENLKRAAEGS